MADGPPDPFFTGPGLDRADSLRSDARGLRDLASSRLARQLQWDNGLPRIAADGQLAWSAAAGAELFLGLDADVPCFSAIEEVTLDARAAFARISLLSPSDAPLFAAAVSLSRWHSRHRYCANCGKLTLLVRGGWSRQCRDCMAEHYPRVDPVVIMLAIHDDKLLLGRQPHFPARRYSALAGFVEVGESLEAAVARELFEEAGIRVHNIRYLASQPWPFPASLMFGCFADALGEELRIDTAELEDARWFNRSEVAAALEGDPDAPFDAPPAIAIAHTLLLRWLAA